MRLEDTQFYKDIEAELANPEYFDFTHGTRKCYEAGCRGQMCVRSNSLRLKGKPMPMDDYLAWRKQKHELEAHLRQRDLEEGRAPFYSIADQRKAS